MISAIGYTWLHEPYTSAKDWFKSHSCRINACPLRSDTSSQPKLSDLSQVLKQTLKRLEIAFVSMWEQSHGFPRFKKGGQIRSFVFPWLGVSPVRQGGVKLPNIGWVKFRLSRPIFDDAKVNQARNGEGIDIDVPIKHFAAPPVNCFAKSSV
ncbi:hypothetical protein [Lyngbya aestuarii]|uniref:hypothetical protein n=1 Tax=Lyngbya aestuarii TaxID=118322 RepID=UPI00403DE00C